MRVFIPAATLALMDFPVVAQDAAWPGVAARTGDDDRAPAARPFSNPEETDLLAVLPPPPENGSKKMQAELAEVLKFQDTRSPKRIERARADEAENIWIYADVIDNPAFNAQSLPLTDAFFRWEFKSEGAVLNRVKAFYHRPRPYDYSDLVKPAVSPSKSGSYPSGHATGGTLAGIVLANMLPEGRGAIFARAWEYGENRIVGGVRYASDVEAARIAASIIAEDIWKHDDFRSELAAAKVELRAALGM